MFTLMLPSFASIEIFRSYFDASEKSNWPCSVALEFETLYGSVSYNQLSDELTIGVRSGYVSEKNGKSKIRS